MAAETADTAPKKSPALAVSDSLSDCLLIESPAEGDSISLPRGKLVGQVDIQFRGNGAEEVETNPEEPILISKRSVERLYSDDWGAGLSPAEEQAKADSDSRKSSAEDWVQAEAEKAFFGSLAFWVEDGEGRQRGEMCCLPSVPTAPQKIKGLSAGSYCLHAALWEPLKPGAGIPKSPYELKDRGRLVVKMESQVKFQVVPAAKEG